FRFMRRRTDIHVHSAAALGLDWHHDGSPLDTGDAALFLATWEQEEAAVLVLFESKEAFVRSRRMTVGANGEPEEAPEPSAVEVPTWVLEEMRRVLGEAFGVDAEPSPHMTPSAFEMA